MSDTTATLFRLYLVPNVIAHVFSGRRIRWFNKRGTGELTHSEAYKKRMSQARKEAPLTARLGTGTHELQVNFLNSAHLKKLLEWLMAATNAHTDILGDLARGLDELKERSTSAN